MQCHFFKFKNVYVVFLYLQPFFKYSQVCFNLSSVFTCCFFSQLFLSTVLETWVSTGSDNTEPFWVFTSTSNYWWLLVLFGGAIGITRDYLALLGVTRSYHWIVMVRMHSSLIFCFHAALMSTIATRSASTLICALMCTQYLKSYKIILNSYNYY